MGQAFAQCDGQNITNECKKKYSMLSQPELYNNCSKIMIKNCNIDQEFQSNIIIGVLGLIGIIGGIVFYVVNKRK